MYPFLRYSLSNTELAARAAASLRITDGGIMKLFTCGPLSYFRIRDMDGSCQSMKYCDTRIILNVSVFRNGAKKESCVYER